MTATSPGPRSTSGTVQDARAFITGVQAAGRGALTPAAVIGAALRSRGSRPAPGGGVLLLGPVGTGKASPLNPLAVATPNKTDMVALRPIDDGRVL